MNELRKKVASSVKIKELGQRTLSEFQELGHGPFEISGVGFAWYGNVHRDRGYFIQTYPFNNDEKFNDAIRWFLMRGFSLNEALKVNAEHMSNLFNQALTASAVFLLGAAGSIAKRAPAPLTSWGQSAKIVKAVVDHPKNPYTPPSGDLVAALNQQFQNAPIHRKIQQLSKIHLIKIRKLQPLR